jgi:hypothetical protein
LSFQAAGRRGSPVNLTLLAFAALYSLASSLEAENPAVKSRPAALVQVAFADGRNIEGALENLSESELSLHGNPDPIPLYEIHEIRIGSTPAGKEPDFSTGAVVAFSSGEKILARVTEISNEAGGPVATISLGEKFPPVTGRLASLSGFRLREKYPDDPVFEKTLEAPPPLEDVFILRRAGLLSASGVFRGLDKDYLQVEIADKKSRVRRQLVQGVILAPIAASRKEADPPARLEIPGLGRLPAYLLGIERTKKETFLLFRLPLSPPREVQRIPLSSLTRILPASDKIVFLSSIEPDKVKETAVLGRGFPYRKDLSVSGAPLRLKGRTYRRGLGVHSRTVLEYALNGGYTTFAAIIGLDDSSRGKGSVTFVVSADGKELLRENFDSSRAPLPISFPVSGARKLTLLVDYGSDQLDLGDHADWVNARLTK